MVLSNTKLKRKKREESAAVADSTSILIDVKGHSPAVLSAKKKKRLKSKAVNGDEKDGTAGSVSEDIGIINSIPEVSMEGNAFQGEESKKKRKTDAEVLLTEVTQMEMEDVGRTLPSVGDAGGSEGDGVDDAAPEAVTGGEGAPIMKIRKKPRWEVDESGKRIKPHKVGGESEGPSNGAKALTSSDKGAEKGDVNNVFVEKDGDAAVGPSDAVDNGDRIHQGDEPWLESKRSKKKKKRLIDKWGKKLDDTEAVDDGDAVNQEAPQVAPR